MAEKDSLIEFFKQQNIQDWHPIVLEFPYFGQDDKQREMIAGITTVFAAGGMNLLSILF